MCASRSQFRSLVDRPLWFAFFLRSNAPPARRVNDPSPPSLDIPEVRSRRRSLVSLGVQAHSGAQPRREVREIEGVGFIESADEGEGFRRIGRDLAAVN